MIDTIKLGVILTRHQTQKLKTYIDKLQKLETAKVRLVDPDREDWEICLNWRTHEILTDGPSYHRHIRFALHSEMQELFFEFSLPKYWIGHNIRLVHDYRKPLEHFRRTMMMQLGLRLPPLDGWIVYRLDLCLAWKFTNQKMAQYYLTGLSKLNFPRKKPINYANETLLFTGATYSVKFYLKHPEFMKHDYRELCKIMNETQENYDEKTKLKAHQNSERGKELSQGVLRFEVTCRRRALKRWGIDRLEDLSQSWSIVKMEELLHMYVGKSKTEVQDILNVEMTLDKHYSKKLSSDLLCFYMFIQGLGKEKAKERFAETTYYRRIKQLKDAGVSLVTGDKFEELSSAEKVELETFELTPYSSRLVNHYDDDRGQESFFNIDRAKQVKEEVDDIIKNRKTS